MPPRRSLIPRLTDTVEAIEPPVARNRAPTDYKIQLSSD